ncbi:EpsG family protein [Acinetobacter indicus]|uniref:EpsG family protein n=1 Tax=Acinetobacter indicus TaxID=756892 RepID=UPI0012661428|nr:EpsG family protein [Acinetobacter indicus]QFS16088.1 EpsG family protein [Acinetobacter indicus]
MIYIFVLFFIGIYLYGNESKKYSNFLNQFIAWFPVFLVFSFFPSFQNQVGTDYLTYFNYFYNDGHQLHYDRGEYLYYYLVELVKFIGEPQLQFFIVSIIQGILFTYLLYMLKINGYKSWLIWFLFMCTTGIYHNQMNILRQAICIYLVLISVVIMGAENVTKKNKIFIFLFNFLISFFLHLSSIFANLIIFFSKITFSKKRLLFAFLFIMSIPIYSLNLTAVITNILEFFNLRYISYIGSDFAQGRSILNILTKVYYLPVILIFWFLYIFDKKDDYLSKNLFSMMIYIFSFTYFLFLQAMDFGLISRIWQYFNFLLIFPLYFVYVRINNFYKLILIVYLIIPYLLKVLFFADAEYSYYFYKGWF